MVSTPPCHGGRGVRILVSQPRDNLMKAMKDKKKFGGCSLTSKNRSCKKFGWSYDKETKRIWRIEAKRMAHKVLMHLPISREEIQKAWSNPYMNLSELGVPYVWDGVGHEGQAATNGQCFAHLAQLAAAGM